MRIHQVDAATLHLVGPLIRQWCASRYSEETPEHIVERAASGHMTLHAVVDGRDVLALFGLSIRETPRGDRYATIDFAVGRDARRWAAAASDHAAEIAKRHGCGSLRHESRPGWERLLRGRAKVARVVLVREI